MKTSIKTLALCGSIASVMALSFPAYAAITMNNSAVGATTTFPIFSISGVNGSLFFQSILASPAGATIQGGSSQGPVAVGTAWGETFNYTGASGNLLSAISIINNGSGGVGTYQPFLFDLGTGLFNTPASQFNPSTQVNLFGATTLTPAAQGSANYLEFDLAGSDAITLTSGHSYAFGLLNNNPASDMNFRRANGTQSDPNGDSFTLTSLAATSDNAAPYSASVRNDFIGVYTTAVPEPTSMALLGLGALVGTFAIRRRKQ